MKRMYLEYYFLIFSLVFGMTWFLYPQLPQVMVTHWGFFGEANGWMDKLFGAWIVPIMASIVWLLWEVSPATHLSHEADYRFYQPYRLMGLFIFLFLGLLQVVVLGINLGWQLDMLKILSWSMVVFTAVLGQLLPRMPRNPLMGIRTPWSMKYNLVWQKTHEETGKWCRGVSLLDIIILIVVAQPLAFFIVMCGFIGCLLMGALLSYVYRGISK